MRFSRLHLQKEQPDRRIQIRAEDLWLLFPVLFLVGLGVAMVYSASSVIAMKRYQSDSYFLYRHILNVMVGFCAMAACRWISIEWLRSKVYLLLGLSVLLLALVLVPGIGATVGGATRWLRIGIVSFQPAEMARVALVIYLAYSMSKKGRLLRQFSIGMIPHGLILVILSGLLLLQPDFGSVVILSIITWVMLFVGGVRIGHLLVCLLPLLGAGFYFLKHSEYRMERWLSFLDPWKYANDSGYQAIHSLMAFGTGGVWGVGIGKGYQKLHYLPEPHTDFIFSVIGEELGLMGVLAVVASYAVILWKGFQIALGTEDPFRRYLATGLTLSMGLLVCINMGVALSLLPTKGLTLPFLSYGGTSMLINLSSVGLLMKIGADRYATPSP